MSATSFISEHTAEYFLNYTLINLFEKSSYDVIPFYYWKSREGANQSKACGIDKEVRLVTIFPRRPKIEEPGQPYIEVKINYSLLITSIICKEFDIPVFAGVPLASSMFQFTTNKEYCSWFYLNPLEVKDEADVVFTISVDNESILMNEIQGIESISEEDLVEFMVRKAPKREWISYIETINEVRSRVRYSENISSSIFSWFGIYKPFYLAIL